VCCYIFVWVEVVIDESLNNAGLTYTAVSQQNDLIAASGYDGAANGHSGTEFSYFNIL